MKHRLHLLFTAVSLLAAILPSVAEDATTEKNKLNGVIHYSDGTKKRVSDMEIVKYNRIFRTSDNHYLGTKRATLKYAHVMHNKKVRSLSIEDISVFDIRRYKREQRGHDGAKNCGMVQVTYRITTKTGIKVDGAYKADGFECVNYTSYDPLTGKNERFSDHFVVSVEPRVTIDKIYFDSKTQIKPQREKTEKQSEVAIAKAQQEVVDLTKRARYMLRLRVLAAFGGAYKRKTNKDGLFDNYERKTQLFLRGDEVTVYEQKLIHQKKQDGSYEYYDLHHKLVTFHISDIENLAVTTKGIEDKQGQGACIFLFKQGAGITETTIKREFKVLKDGMVDPAYPLVQIDSRKSKVIKIGSDNYSGSANNPECNVILESVKKANEFGLLFQAYRSSF